MLSACSDGILKYKTYSIYTLHKVKVYGFFPSKGVGVQSLKAKSRSRKIQSMPIANVWNFVTEKWSDSIFTRYLLYLWNLEG